MTTAEHNCQACLFKDGCPSFSNWGCQNYTPEDEDEDLDQYIEDRRMEYYDEWNAYMSEDWD